MQKQKWEGLIPTHWEEEIDVLVCAIWLNWSQSIDGGWDVYATIMVQNGEGRFSSDMNYYNWCNSYIWSPCFLLPSSYLSNDWQQQLIAQDTSNMNQLDSFTGKVVFGDPSIMYKCECQKNE